MKIGAAMGENTNKPETDVNDPNGGSTRRTILTTRAGASVAGILPGRAKATVVGHHQGHALTDNGLGGPFQMAVDAFNNMQSPTHPNGYPESSSPLLTLINTLKSKRRRDDL